MTVADTMAPSQRFTRFNPCPICGGFNSMRPGKGIRCAGFISSDEEYAFCQREQFAGDLPLNDNTMPPTYMHKLKGACRCGSSHDLTSPEPCMQAPSRAKKKVVHYAREADGTIIGEHVRLYFLDDIDEETGKPKKQGPWWKNHRGRSSTEMPFYGLPRLAAAAPEVQVWIVEGEPAQEALQSAFDAANRPDIAVGTMTGAPAIPCDDRLQVLIGHPVILWQDNDDVGRQQMERMAARLRALGTDPPIWVRWKDAPPKGDAVDYFAAGGTVEGLKNLIASEPDDVASVSQPEAVQPFPLEALPHKVGAFIQAAADAIGCPVDLVAVPALAVASAAIGNSQALQVEEGYVEYPRVWAITVARSGDGKSPALGQALAPSQSRQNTLARTYRASVREWEEKRGSDEKADPRPIAEHAVITDATMEALTDTLLHSPRGFLLALDEATSLVMGMNQYKGGGKGNDRPHYLKIWSGEPFDHLRVSRQDPLHVEHPFMSVVGNIPPDMLTSLEEHAGKEDGLLARLLFYVPPAEARSRRANKGHSHELPRGLGKSRGCTLPTRPSRER